MLSVDEFANRVGIKPRTVKKAIKEGRVRHFLAADGSSLIPKNEVRPLTKAQIQDFLWVVLEYKNSPVVNLDISTVDGIRTEDIKSVFLQLAYRNYLDSFDDTHEASNWYDECRITTKGLELLRKGKLPGSIRNKAIESLEVIQLVSAIAVHLQGLMSNV